MSILQDEALASREQSVERSLILLEAEIGQRKSAVTKLPASLVGGEVASEARDVFINGNVWEWRKTFHVKLPVSSKVDKPICVSTIGSSEHDCNIALQSDEILPIQCQVYAQLNSGHDCWILENRSDSVVSYSNDETFSDRFHASDPIETLGFKSLSRDQIALHHLRGLAVGPFVFNLRIPSDQLKTQAWFSHNPPCLVSEQMLREQSGKQVFTLTDFQKIRRIGRGGFGDVIEVMEKISGLKLALKSQHIQSRRKQIQVEKEICNMKKLRSVSLLLLPKWLRLISTQPFIVDILTQMQTERDGTLKSYICMPLYRMDLSTALQTPELTMDFKERVMFHVTTGLAYMHKQGILHRDIKPQNILIASMNPVKAVLADLGVCADVGEDQSVMGTEAYWAPEYFSSFVATFATDTFALGITFLEIIEPELTRACCGINSLVKSFVHPPRKWSAMIRQMTYVSPEDRPTMQAISRAIEHGQDLPPNEYFEEKNARLPALAPAKEPSRRATPEWSPKSSSFASQDHTPPHTLPYGATMDYLSVAQLQEDWDQEPNRLRTARPPNATPVVNRSASEPDISQTGNAGARTPRDLSDIKPLASGSATSGAPTESSVAQGRTIPSRGSHRHRAPTKRDDVLRRVRAGRIAKPKVTSASNAAIDTPRVQPTRPGSWRAAAVARELEKTGAHTR